MTQRRNRLAKETSAWLKGATHQPVDRYPWGEDSHQDYFAKNPSAGYSRAAIAPKVANSRKEFRDLLKG